MFLTPTFKFTPFTVPTGQDALNVRQFALLLLSLKIRLLLIPRYATLSASTSQSGSGGAAFETLTGLIIIKSSPVVTFPLFVFVEDDPLPLLPLVPIS